MLISYNVFVSHWCAHGRAGSYTSMQLHSRKVFVFTFSVRSSNEIMINQHFLVGGKCQCQLTSVCFWNHLISSQINISLLMTNIGADLLLDSFIGPGITVICDAAIDLYTFHFCVQCFACNKSLLMCFQFSPVICHFAPVTLPA